MFKNTFKIFQRELSVVLKDRDVFILILIAPLFYAFVYASLYYFKTEEKVPVAVVDMDRSEFSETFTRRINTSKMLDAVLVTGDMNEARGLMASMRIHGIIYIPHNASSNLKSRESITITVFLNTTRFLVSNDINKAVSEVALSFNEEARRVCLQSIGYSSREAENLSEPVKSDIRPMFNNPETYGDYLIPGLLVLILHQTLLIGLSECIAREREYRAIGEIKKLSGNSVTAAVAGKAVFYFILYTAYSLFIFAAAFPVFKINLLGSVSALFLTTSLMILSAIFLAIFVSSFFRRKFVALIITAFTSYPLFFISGYVFPSYALPVPLQYLSKAFAITPYLRAFSRITQLGAGFGNVCGELAGLSVITLVLFGLAWLRIKYLFSKEV